MKEYLRCYNSVPSSGSALASVSWYLDGLLLRSLPDCRPAAPPGSCQADPTRLLLESVNRHFHGNFSCQGKTVDGLQSERKQPRIFLAFRAIFYLLKH